LAAADFDDGALTPARFWAVFAVLFLVAALPVLRVELPPLFDYPNHLARMDLLVRLPGSQALQRYYELRWRVIPNLGMDLIVPALARVLPLAWAGKAFVLVTFALVAAGTGLVHRAAAGQWSLWPLFVFLFLYSRVLLWGFLNYLFGVGLALAAFALWIVLSQRDARSRLAISGALALALFFVHLMACVVYGVLVAGYELGALWRSWPRPSGGGMTSYQATAKTGAMKTAERAKKTVGAMAGVMAGGMGGGTVAARTGRSWTRRSCRRLSAARPRPCSGRGRRSQSSLRRPAAC